ncbi:unnamed protein product [Arctia plantaginis]|uniref:Uncharacterized protein n=1 Tax=Arctia plantaginis TaxID=874455 RepID=A0A8S0YNL8_ARCPL|nr:unnamed protein product [Arctia plantaginis]
MSVRRSPQSVNTAVGQSGSQSDFTDDSDIRITQRKRKQRECCDLTAALNNFRVEMISALQTNLKPMRDDISTMKDQINEVKSSMAKMLAEQDGIKAEIAELKKNNNNADFKISQLETIVTKLTPTSASPKQTHDDIFSNEKVINELQERASRSKNIVMIGLLESTLPDIAARQAADISGVKNILKNIAEHCQIQLMLNGKVTIKQLSFIDTFPVIRQI